MQIYDSDQEYEQRGPTPTSMDVRAFNARAPPPPGRSPRARAAGGRRGVSVTPTDHRNYALTWFSLSGATAFLASRVLRAPVGRR